MNSFFRFAKNIHAGKLKIVSPVRVSRSKERGIDMRAPKPKEIYTANIDETETRFPLAADNEVRRNKNACGGKEGQNI